jgi:hypothetical protein
MSIIEVVLILAIVFAIGVAVFAVSSKGKALIASEEAKLKAEWDSLHAKLDGVLSTLHIIHQTALAPVLVAAAPTAVAPAVAPAVPVDPTTPTVVAGPTPASITISGSHEQVVSLANFLASGMANRPADPVDTAPAVSKAGFDLDVLKPAENPFPGPGGDIFTFTGDNRQNMQVFSVAGSSFKGFVYSINGGPDVHQDVAGTSSFSTIPLAYTGKVSVKVHSFDSPLGTQYGAQVA